MALLNLSECWRNFFKCLETYMTISPTPIMSELLGDKANQSGAVQEVRSHIHCT